MSKIGNQLKNGIVLKSPRITEKSTDLAEGGKSAVYVFEVAKGSTKTEIKQAFIAKYKAQPVKINVVNLPSKNVVRRGRKGVRPGVRKAMVFLKAGEKIEII
jgi:large subunit ribosomal protein L23